MGVRKGFAVGGTAVTLLGSAALGATLAPPSAGATSTFYYDGAYSAPEIGIVDVNGTGWEGGAVNASGSPVTGHVLVTYAGNIETWTSDGTLPPHTGVFTGLVGDMCYPQYGEFQVMWKNSSDQVLETWNIGGVDCLPGPGL